ncbi:MAG: MMPL family transporter, partial [Myxococcota bacterium]|nr:MMPL family transporter [Myxococcota bacterium]
MLALIQRLAHGATDHPRRILLVLFVAILAAAWFARNVQLDNDPRQLVAQQSEEAAFLDLHRDRYGVTDTTALVAIEVGELTPAASIDLVQRISEALAQVDGVVDVASPTETPVAYGTDGLLTVSPAFGSRSDIDLPFQERVDLLRTRGTGTSRLVSAEGRTFLVAAQMDESFADPQLAATPLQTMEQLVSKLTEQAGGGAHSWLGGIPGTRVGSVQSIRDDLYLLTPLGYALVALLLAVQLRRTRAVVLPLAVVAVSVGLTLGFVGLRGEPLNPLSQ